MKRVFYVIILMSIVSVFSSCSKFLEEDNKSGITNEEFYRTATGFETLMTASYNSLRTVYGNPDAGDDATWVFWAGTDMYQRSRSTGDRSLMEYEQLYAADNKVLQFYTNVYSGIQTINMGLYYIDRAELSDALRSAYKAELRFLRAFYHFILLEQFGGIPVNSEATLSPRTNIPRSSLADTYSFITSEMEQVVDQLGVSNTRMNKSAGHHFLAKVYLTKGWDLGDNGDFEKAKSHATLAIGGKGITIPFESLWSPNNENNDEFLFSVQYDAASISGPTKGHFQQSLFGAYLGGTESMHKYMTSYAYPSWSLHSFYSANDARYDATFMLTMYDKYFDYYSADTSTLKIAAYYPRVWGREYTASDSIAWLSAHAGRLTSNFRFFPFKYNEEAYRYAYQTDMSTPVIKKFDSPSTRSTFSSTASVRDIVLARRAETYFLYAEACIGMGQFALAEQYVQTVLNRPGNSKNGGTLVPSNTLSSAANRDEALNAYLIESAKEFAGEYLRWPELRRTRKLKEFCNKYNYDIKALGGADAVFKGQDGNDKIYRPIPQSAIDLNDALSNEDQNPGY